MRQFQEKNATHMGPNTVRRPRLKTPTKSAVYVIPFFLAQVRIAAALHSMQFVCVAPHRHQPTAHAPPFHLFQNRLPAPSRLRRRNERRKAGVQPVAFAHLSRRTDPGGLVVILGGAVGRWRWAGVRVSALCFRQGAPGCWSCRLVTPIAASMASPLVRWLLHCGIMPLFHERVIFMRSLSLFADTMFWCQGKLTLVVRRLYLETCGNTRTHLHGSCTSSNVWMVLTFFKCSMADPRTLIVRHLSCVSAVRSWTSSHQPRWSQTAAW